MGDGILLFADVRQVIILINITIIIRYTHIIIALRVILVDINKHLSHTLTQVHEGEYVCRVDNRVGREEAMVKLYLQGQG
jgi:hypothetical protein